MKRKRRPLQVAVYQDVLCAWSYVACARLEVLAHELGELVRLRPRPFSMRLDEARRLTEREQESQLAAICRAQREAEGARLTPELWLSGDLPTSTLPAQVAIEAARLQGPSAAAQLASLMRRAALEHGVNVCRRDVAFELAGRAGLDVGRFAAAYDSRRTARWLVEEQKLAAARGVRVVPTLVIGERWMLCGLRSLEEYRRHLLECCRRSRTFGSGLPEGLVH